MAITTPKLPNGYYWSIAERLSGLGPWNLTIRIMRDDGDTMVTKLYDVTMNSTDEAFLGFLEEIAKEFAHKEKLINIANRFIGEYH